MQYSDGVSAMFVSVYWKLYLSTAGRDAHKAYVLSCFCRSAAQAARTAMFVLVLFFIGFSFSLSKLLYVC